MSCTSNPPHFAVNVFMYMYTRPSSSVKLSVKTVRVSSMDSNHSFNLTKPVTHFNNTSAIIYYKNKELKGSHSLKFLLLTNFISVKFLETLIQLFYFWRFQIGQHHGFLGVFICFRHRDITTHFERCGAGRLTLGFTRVGSGCVAEFDTSFKPELSSGVIWMMNDE
jgi:hypothetical protein